MIIIKSIISYTHKINKNLKRFIYFMLQYMYNIDCKIFYIYY